MLLLSDPVDRLWTALPFDFGGKPFKSLSKGDVDFGLVPLLEEAAKEESKLDEPDAEAVIGAR